MLNTLDVGIDIQGELISEHYIKNRLKKSKEFEEISQEAEKKFAKIKDIYENVKDVIEAYEESDLEEEFIKPVLSELGFGKECRHVQPPFLSHKGVEERPDFALFDDEENKKESIKNRDVSDDYFDFVIGLIEAKKVDKDLDKGRKRNPAVQIKRYLRMTKVRWGILTNGKKWRLYCEDTGYSSNVHLEFDLFSILEHNKKMVFNYFYTFFSHASFKKEKGKSFLDEIFEENVKFAREVEDDLEKNVYEALKVLSEGFLHYNPNDLGIENLAKIHDSSLILLYRKLFLFYAESKGLIEFGKHFKKYSMLDIREDVKEDIKSNQKYAPLDDSYWMRIKRTFEIINSGSEKVIGEKGIPPYNGGLFDSEKHEFLEEYSIDNNHLMEAIDLLARRKGKEGWDWVDYETLQIRHLGSIYEKLLEYKLDIASEDLTVDDGEYVPSEEDDEIVVEKDEVYLKTDKGERKATGSYYTPDYIVQYIVENTVGELIDEKTDEAEEKGESEAKAILEMEVLDPAMGSGHFLVGAVEYMAEELVSAVNRDIENGVWSEEQIDLEEAKREIVSHCIYGVDVNPLAVELAKLSLWLTTLSEGKPLNFLDHKLKCGNSLIGTEIDKLPYFPGEDKKGNLYTPYIELLTEQVSKLDEIEDESIKDIKKKEELFKEIKESKAYKRVKTLADARTATYFGVDIGGSRPKKRYMNLVNEAYYGSEKKWEERSSKRWVKKGFKVAEDKRFFHWQLEFPEVFFEKGEFKENPGFDVVIGNPPWAADIENEKYVKEKYKKTKRANDTASYFLELSSNLSKANSYGMIVKNSIVFIDPWKEVRDLVIKDGLNKVLNPGVAFEDANIESVVIITNGKNNKKYNINVAEPLKKYKDMKKIEKKGNCLLSLVNNLETLIVNPITNGENDLLYKLTKENLKFRNIIDRVCRGSDIDKDGNSSICYVRQGPQTERYLINYCKSLPKSAKSKKDIKELLIPKLIAKPLRGMELVFCSDNKGNVFTGSNYSNITIKKNSDFSLNSLLSIFNSKLISFFMAVGVYSKNTETARHLDEAYIGRAPIPTIGEEDGTLNGHYIDKNIPDIWNYLSSENINSKDLIEILDYLAKKISSFKKERKEITDDFYTDLEGITEEETFKRLKKGKQGRTLFRKETFKPYVEEGSYTTHHLHEALNWHKDAFKQFVKLLTKNIPNLSDVMNVFEKYYQELNNLNENIIEIDNIIETLVFKLYELNEDEIEVVLYSLDTDEEIKEGILKKYNEL